MSLLSRQRTGGFVTLQTKAPTLALAVLQVKEILYNSFLGNPSSGNQEKLPLHNTRTASDL